MDKFGTIINELQKLGLSSNQANIYIQLVNKGELRIQEIVDLTQIPRSSVYENLKALSELGLIEKVIDYNFTKVKPYPVSVMKHSLRENINNLQTQVSNLDTLETSLKNLTSQSLSSATTIRYYQDLVGARQLFWNTLNSQSEVYVYSSFGRSQFVGKSFYVDFVKESAERKIKERVLINPSTATFDMIRKDTGTSIARTDPKDIRVIAKTDLLIEGETFLYDHIFAQIKLDDSRITGFEIESQHFTAMQKSIFETLWQQAKPVANML